MQGEAPDMIEQAVANAAALWGHDLRFVGGLPRRRKWVVCSQCRMSCYMTMATPEQAERAMEKWMHLQCGSLSYIEGSAVQKVDDPEYGYQLLHMCDGSLRVVFLNGTLDTETLARVAADPRFLDVALPLRLPLRKRSATSAPARRVPA